MYIFLDWLVEDIMKFLFSSSPDPEVNTCHLGMSILEVLYVGVHEQIQMDEDVQAAKTGTNCTVAKIKVVIKDPPPLPTIYDKGMQLWMQYKIFLQELLCPKCAYLVEVHLIHLSLRSLQNKALEKMDKDDWVHIIWELIIDARQ